MSALLLIVVLVAGFVVLALTLLTAMSGVPRRIKWLSLGTIAVAAPLFYWSGVFSESFVAGQCYSNAMGMVAQSVERTSNPQQLAAQIRALPMHGYETVCSDVEKAAGELPNVVAP